MSQIKYIHITLIVFAGLLISGGGAAIFASLAEQDTNLQLASASIIDGVSGYDSPNSKIVAPKLFCGGDVYGECEGGSAACVTNQIGDYRCVRLPIAKCPSGAVCAKCSQSQLTQCLKYHKRTTACAVVTKDQIHSTLCSHE